MKWFIISFLLFTHTHILSAEKSEKKIKADSAAVKKQKPISNIHSRRINQLSDANLNQSIESLLKLLDELPLVCQNDNSLDKRVTELQQRLMAIKQKIRQIKEDFRISDPSIHSYVNTLDFYFNKPEEFNYEREVPKNTEEIKKYVSTLTFSFQYMYQLAFNIPENTPLDKFPEGWGRSIGTALTCLKNNE